MKLFDRFRAAKELVNETEFVKIYRCVWDGKEYRIILTKRRANRHTVIHCVNRDVAWEQVPLFPRNAGRNYGDKMPIYRYEDNADVVQLFVVKGRPNGFVGLDNGVFCCVDRFDEGCLNVMSYRRFKNM